MALASQTLSLLQAAGAAVNAAALALQQEFQAHSQALMDQMALQPFGPEADGAYQQMRQVARLVHEMNSLEQQLKAIYLDAAKKSEPEVPVLPALPSTNRQRRLTRNAGATEHESVEDAKVVQTKGRQRKLKVANAPWIQESKLSNTDRLHAALKKLLGKKAKAVGHSELSALSGLPRGSIGASIKKLIEIQKLAVDADGVYRLL